MSEKMKQTHIYDSDSNVEAYGEEEGESEIDEDEQYQMVYGVDGDFSNHWSKHF